MFHDISHGKKLDYFSVPMYGNFGYDGLNMMIKKIDNMHDRYIVIDESKLYHIGASIKDLGKKIFSISESDNLLIDELLKNL